MASSQFSIAVSILEYAITDLSSAPLRTATIAGTDGVAATNLEGIFPTLSYYAGAGIDPNGLLNPGKIFD